MALEPKVAAVSQSRHAIKKAEKATDDLSTTKKQKKGKNVYCRQGLFSTFMQENASLA